jgi:HEAT repeat protein
MAPRSITQLTSLWLLTCLKVVVLGLAVFLLWSGCSWAQVTSDAQIDAKIAPLVEKLTDHSPRVRRDAADALVNIGSPAVPALITALHDPDRNLRWYAASVLGDLGTEAAPAVPALTSALHDEDSEVRLYAILALGNLGMAAKSAVPALITALKDADPYVRIYAPTVLRKLGVAAKVAVPALISALKDPNGRVRLNAAYALGAMGTEAADAVPDLIATLNDEQLYVRFGAVKGLGGIAGSFQDQSSTLSRSRLTRVMAEFEQALKILEAHPESFTEADIARVRRPLSALQIEQDSRFFDKAWDWLLQRRWILAVVSYVVLLPSLWLLVLRLQPLWLLQINNALKPYTDFSLPVVGIQVPLRLVLFVGLFHYHPRVLDAWVAQYLQTARAQFLKKDTAQARSCCIPIPVILDGNTIAQLTVEDLQPTFAKQRSCLVIWGEGGVGKTSLACQLGGWAMAEPETQRLCQHWMLPVLLEEEFRLTEGKSPLLEAIRGQLQALIDEPEPICQELLERLLRKRRLLVIVDHLSEMNATTRSTIQPDSSEFPVNALVITSRLEESLGRVTKTTLKPLRIEGNKLSSFMEAYLMQRGQRDRFTDPEFFEACNRLSLMVGQRQITVLLAKLYAEQLIAAQSQLPDAVLPDTIPSLMLGYLNELNREVAGEKLDDRTVHQAAKAIAWECLRHSYKPTTAKRADAITALATLFDDQSEAHLDYLEHRLYLIQTIGSAQDQIRFCLDPLAEYLAGLFVVEQYGNQDNQWRASVLKQAEDLVKSGEQDSIRGFLLAVRDCYLSQIPLAQESNVVPQKLGKLAGLASQVTV